METKQVSQVVDKWMLEEDLPARTSLKLVRRFDNKYGYQRTDLHGDEAVFRNTEDELDEAEAYWDFIHNGMSHEHQLFLNIPKPEERDFMAVELDEFGDNVSAFNTHDFDNLNPFNIYHWKLKKIYERVKALALNYSCASTEEGKKNIKQRYINLVENEFRDEAVMLLEHHKKHSVWMNKHKTMEKIEELNSKIRKCKKIWSEYANWE